MSEVVRWSKEAGIATIIIDNPPVNALSTKVREELGEIFTALASDPGVRAVILTGEGKVFVAGADLTEVAKLDQPAGWKRAARGAEIYSKISNFPGPVICAVNGSAFGGGCELTLWCDLRIASTRAKFCLPETSLGLIPGAGGTQRLPRLIPAGKARRMIFTGEVLDAMEALEWGLVEEVVEPEHLLERAREVSGQILAKGPLAIQLAKRAINGGLEMPLEQGLLLEREYFAQVCGTEDKKEGIAAFFEKRKPMWVGR